MITRHIYALVCSVLWTIFAVKALLPGFYYHFKNILYFFRLASNNVTILIVCFPCSFVHNWATEQTQKHKNKKQKEQNEQRKLSVFKTKSLWELFKTVAMKRRMVLSTVLREISNQIWGCVFTIVSVFFILNVISIFSFLILFKFCLILIFASRGVKIGWGELIPFLGGGN